MNAHDLIVAEVERELAEMEAENARVAARLAERGTRRQSGASVVYSIRLDRGEVEALERRAAARGLKPTVLARNLVRMGLSMRTDHGIADAVARLEGTVAELRALVGQAPD